MATDGGEFFENSALSRRAIRAVIAGTIVFVVTGTGLGVAGASGDADSALPFSVPSPWSGDRGSYESTLAWRDSVGREEILERRNFAEFEWLDERAARDAGGRLHSADAISILYPEKHFTRINGVDVPHVVTLVFEEDTGEQLLYEVVYSATTTDTVSDSLTGASSTLDFESLQLSRHYDAYPWTNEPCGLRNRIQGLAVPPSAKADLFYPCGLGANGQIPLHGHAFDLEAIHEGKAALYVAELGSGKRIEATFEPGIPYATRVETILPGKSGQSLVGRLELTAFERGTPSGLLARSPTEVAGWEPLVLSPRQVWGLDESGVQHPFPASEAFLRARVDPDFPDLRDYLADHPDAYVAFAWYNEDVSRYRPDDLRSGEFAYQWNLLVSDGESKFTFSIIKRTAPPERIPWLGLAGRQTTYEYVGFGCSCGWQPLPEDAPAAVPKLDQLMSRWRDEASASFADLEPNSWGFHIFCETETCDAVHYEVEAGHDRREIERCHVAFGCADDQGYVGFNRWSGLRWDDAGRMLSLDEGAGWTNLTEDPLAAWRPGQADDEYHPAAAETLTPCCGGSHWYLSREATFAALLLGAVGAVVYWIWPYAKSALVVGLFSRIERNELLVHPVRAEVHALVTANPGVHFKAMTRGLAISPGHLQHHLRKLVAAGLLVRRTVNGYSCYFVRGASSTEEAAKGSLLKSAGGRAVHQYVCDNPGTTISTVARECGLSIPTVTYHVDRLGAVGLMTAVREGRTTRVFPGVPATETRD